MTGNRAADPQNPVLDGTQEVRTAFAEWFVNASPDEIREVVAINGVRTQQLKDRGELIVGEKPRTWDGNADPWSARPPSGPSPRAP